MTALLCRLLLLVLGLGAMEIGLARAVMDGSAGSWALVLGGLALLVAGSAGFMVPLFGGGVQRGPFTDA